MMSSPVMSSSRMQSRAPSRGESRGETLDSPSKISRFSMGPTGSPKHARLRAALCKKLLKKYDPGLQNSQVEAYIAAEVDDLLRQPRVTEESLQRLESRIRTFSSTECQNMLLVPFKTVYKKYAAPVDEWRKLNEYQMDILTNEQKKKQTTLVTQKQRTKAELDSQVLELAAAKEKQRLERQKEAQMITNATEQFLQEQLELKEKRNAKFRAERHAREDEMAEVQRRRIEEKKQRQLDDEIELKKVREAMAAEVKAREEKKAAMQERLKVWKSENDQVQRIKDKQREEQLRKEREDAQQAAKIIEEQALAREQQLNELKQRMKGRERQAMLLASEKNKHGEEDQERMLQAQKDALQKADEAFQKKKRESEQKKMEMIASLEQQIVQGKKRKEEEVLFEAKQAATFKQAAEEELQKELAKKEAIRKKKEEHRAALEDQIRMRLATKKKALIMSDTERAINRRFLPSLDKP